MFNHNLPRIAGAAGIISAILMLALTAIIGDGTSSSPLLPVYFVVGSLLGLALTAGLYRHYRKEGTWAVVAAAAATIGNLFFIVAGLLSLDLESPILAIADILVYVVGVSLFSWLAFRTGKMPRALALVGFAAGAAGVANYAITIIFGVDWTNPSDPLGGVLSAIYMVYLIAVVIWLAWTGYSLMCRNAQPALA